MAPPFRHGDMVWSYFPFAETPDLPARTRHAAIIIGAFSAIDASKMLGHPAPACGAAVAVYTSSQVRKFGDNLPIGIVQVPLDRARQNKNNSAFFIDTRVRAYLPIHKDYFPDLDAADHGLIASIDPGLFRRIMQEFARVNERAREQIVTVGPLRPR
ncbi:hypothetical protein [Bradyrhizobium japonicum]|uniref:hypothetical protein n=1 Tax=Bradyrhizobium japonicum TaxID=375 RepID=UPI001BAA1CD8|nr:hypothetical protein [Bradyrhizobium japonicum]MBR0962058.1 hypothetical protein [Bradyrhizobium japonicum]